MTWTEPLTVNVTQADIDEGMRRNCSECPVALAARRTIGEGMIDRTVYVDAINIMLLEGGITVALWRMPESAGEFVDAFDSERGTVYPITFVAEPVL